MKTITKAGTIKKMAMLLAALAMTATIVAGPASADEIDLDGDDGLFFLGYPGYSIVDDVDYKNVRERNDRDGECRVQDVDLDGFIAEYELTCYY
jgi:hypothetical protein